MSDFGSGLGAVTRFCQSRVPMIAIPRCSSKWYLWAVSRSRKFALSLAVLLVAAACPLVIAGLWIGILAALAAVVAAGAAIWPLITAQPKALPPPEMRVPGWVIDRPTEIAQVITALIDGKGRTAGITTALEGAGGFGKTTLAKMACMDRRVREHFGGRIYPVTVGRDLRTGAALAAEVNDVIRLVAGEEANFTDPELAGKRLGALLNAGPPRLLLLDDVWEPEQLTPFTDGGRTTRCAIRKGATVDLVTAPAEPFSCPARARRIGDSGRLRRHRRRGHRPGERQCCVRGVRGAGPGRQQL